MHALIRRLALPLTIALVATSLGGSPAVAVPTWVPATVLSVAGQAAFEAQVAVNGAGDAAAIWTGGDSSNYRSQVSTRSAGGTWTTPTTLSDPGQLALHPQVVVDDAGNTTAVWQRFDGAAWRIQTSTRPAGGTWSTPTNLSNGGSAYSPQLTVDGAGNTTAIWQGFDDGGRARIQTSTRPAAGAWAPVVTHTPPGADGYDPQVSGDDAGNVTAVWRFNDGTQWRIQAVTRSAGGSWGPVDTLSDPDQHAYGPQIAVSSAGDAAAVWYSSDGTHNRIQTSSRAVGGSWGSVVTLSDPGQDAHFPQIALDSFGSATAVWSRSDGAHTRIQASSRPAAGAWSTPVFVSVPGEDAYTSQVAVDAAGRTTAVWVPNDGTHTWVLASTRPPGGTWSTPVSLADPSPAASGAQVAVDPAGNALAVWDRSNAGDQRIEARALDVDGPVVDRLTAPASGTTGEPLAFSVTATDTWSAISSVQWDFGDGTTTSGASVTHTYANAGSHTVKVTLTDAVGNSTLRTATVGVTEAPVVPPAPTAPEITQLRLKPKQIEIKGPKRKTRTKVVLRLTEDARVKVLVKRKGTKAKQKVVLRKSLDTGRSKLRLTSKKIKRKLGERHFRPGRYKLTVKAVNSAGKDRRSVTLRVRR